jgi:hypothetical protein
MLDVFKIDTRITLRHRSVICFARCNSAAGGFQRFGIAIAGGVSQNPSMGHKKRLGGEPSRIGPSAACRQRPPSDIRTQISLNSYAVFFLDSYFHVWRNTK